LLSWTPYTGTVAFSAYWVLRNEAGRTQVDTLLILTQADQTAFIDSSLELGKTYSYRVSVLNEGGYEVDSEEQAVRPVELPTVAVTGLIFDATTASAQLEWAPYLGPHFQAYEVHRRVMGQSRQRLATIADLNTNIWTDDALLGNTPYEYQIVVLTDRDELIAGPWRGEILHPLVATWPQVLCGYT